MNAETFIRESNKIEGITRDPTPEEIAEFHRFMALKKVTIAELEQFVNVYQPGAVLRDKKGLDVTVGDFNPPEGGLHIPALLDILLDVVNSKALPKFPTITAYEIHIRYETLHPFTDGNGRSGRMLWAWQMRQFPLGFLHHFYYQSLQGYRFQHLHKD